MPPTNGAQLTGTYVLGVFRGVTQEKYPKLSVETTPSADGSPFEERLQYTPFDPNTGASVLPEGLQPGQRVAVRVFLEAVAWMKDGKQAPFVGKRALEVIAI